MLDVFGWVWDKGLSKSEASKMYKWNFKHAAMWAAYDHVAACRWREMGNLDMARAEQASCAEYQRHKMAAMGLVDADQYYA